MKKIRDPIHKDIYLEPAALAVVDAPKFQRLRRIHQLGTANLVYPGANHTRFEHSLGAYHLATLAGRALGLEAGLALDLRMAALLHDVGHGPFSHLTDFIMMDALGKSHVDVSREALDLPAIRDALERHGATPSRVGDLIAGKGPLGNLVSGDLDCDRMDYLVRDAHYTGVEIGVDLARLTSELALTPEGVALRPGAVPSAEMLLVTRFTMYNAVYFHHTSRVAETMLDRAIRLAIDGGEIQPQQLPAMDDYALVHLLRGSKTAAWRFMLAVDQRKLFKVAHEAALDETEGDAPGDLSPAAAERLATDRAAKRALESEIAAGAGVPSEDVIVDVPSIPRFRAVSVKVLAPDGAQSSLADSSPLVAALAVAERSAWRLRVVAPASKRAVVAAAATKAISRVA